MKRRLAVIMAALLIAAMAGCSQSGTSSTADSSTVQSSSDSSAAESTESEISEAESSVVSEVTSTESSEENSKTSKAESSDNKSKTESSKTKTEEKSKPESSKPETSKTETSKTETSKAETSKTEEVKATGISIDLSTLSLTAGYGYELNAYILWSNNTSSYQGITWSSNNSSVASVNSTGYVTAKSAGTATITASYGSYSKSCTVTVKAAQQTQPSQSSQPSGGGNSGSNNGGSNNGGSHNNAAVVLKYNYDNLYEVEVGDTLSVKPYVIENGVLLAGAGDEKYKISYKSSNTAVATVSSDGYVKGISEGSATITATYGSSSVSVTVSVLKASGSSGSVYQGGKIVKGDWGWTQYDEQIGFWVVDSMYKDQWGNEYHAKTLEKDHAKDKLVTRNGKYACYLCPEIVPAFNAYLKDHGYNYEFKWYCDLEDGHRDVTNYKNKDSNHATQGCIDNYEMMCKTQIMSHEVEYSCGGAKIIGDMCEGYDFYGLIKSIHEEAPSHWNGLLRAAQKRGVITAVLAPNIYGSGFCVFINL